jgi:uridylate kinase
MDYVPSHWNRVLLKLGGEMFGGGQVGLDPDVVQDVARQIADVVSTGAQVAVVIGGGNFAVAPTTWECSAPS